MLGDVVAYLITLRSFVRLFVSLLVIAVFTLPVGRAPLASEATSTPSTESVDGRDLAEDTETANGSGEGAVCETIEQQAEDADEGPACHGILTCTFYVARHLIVLPFRLLRGALDIII